MHAVTSFYIVNIHLKKIKQASAQPGATREKHFEFPSSHTLAVDRS